MPRKIASLVKLTRPGNCLGAGIAAGLGAFLAGAAGKHDKAALAMGVVTLVTAFGNAINDIYDVEIDRVNMPFRPLVTGEITRRDALFVATGTAAGGLALALLINPAAFWLSVASVVLLWVYSARLKGMFLVGNLTVSALGGMALMYGSVAVDKPWAVLGAMALIALLILAREILKCVEDYEGDLRARLHTIAVVIGRRRALDVFSVLMLACIAAVPLYALTTHLALLLVFSSLLISAVLAISLAMARRPSRVNLRRGVVLTKASFFMGMALLLLSRLM